MKTETYNLHRASLLIIVFSWFSLTSCAAEVTDAEDCYPWLEETNTIVSSTAVPERYQKTLEMLARSCKIIPEGLQKAAQKSIDKSKREQLEILGRAATPYFSGACVSEDFSMPASKLLHICLGSDFPHGEFGSILSKIDAGSYLYGKALKQEFLKNEVYDSYGKRIVLNFFLSNAVLRESDP